MKTISLNTDWSLLERPLYTDVKDAPSILTCEDGWMTVNRLPCDVHMPLMAYGKIADPNVGMGSELCKWVEDRSWWFKKVFSVDAADQKGFGAELVLETLDIHADIFLNGVHIGHHASAMYPFRKEVSPQLKTGENVLLVRLTTGLERVVSADINPIRDFVSCEWRTRREGRGDERRAMLRKPQYVFGWDQAPRLSTCGIGGDARIELFDEVVVRDIRFETLSLHDGDADILAEVTMESRERLFARNGRVVFTVEKDGEVVHTAEQSFISGCGLNYLDFSFTLHNAALWWPNGYGEQVLYTVRAHAYGDNGAEDERTLRTGVRTVKWDESPINDTERRCAVIINGKRIYCRGADVIQMEHLYMRTTEQLQQRIFTLARDAHFCMVRFWDGNLYQSDAVYDLCDEYGLLVLQNFCFACGAYPDHLESFCAEVEREAEYQLRRLRNRPSLVMWYGNGECAGNLSNYMQRHYFEECDGATYPAGTYLYNQLLPKLHHAYVRTVPYLCATPFGGFETVGCAERGDRHYYPFLHLDPEKQQWRISAESLEQLRCKFITECGVMGPPSVEALSRYVGGAEHIDYTDPVFEHHRNTFEKLAVRDAIYRHYTGERALSAAEYCLYGGVFQGTMIGFVADHIRVQPECGGSVLWCLTDGFGEVGFSFLDHDGNPKPVYYYLKRAYEARRLILKREGDEAVLYAANSSHTAWETTVRYGYTAFDGVALEQRTINVALAPFTDAMVIARFPIGEWDTKKGVVFATADGAQTATLRVCDFRELAVPRKASLTLSDFVRDGNALTFTVTTDVFAHAVHFGLSAEHVWSDEYFDLLPDEKKTVTLYDSQHIEPCDIVAMCVK